MDGEPAEPGREDAPRGGDDGPPVDGGLGARRRAADATMPVWIPRAIAYALLGVVLLWSLGWLLSRLRGLLLLLLVALFLSFAIEPLVNRLAARGLSRGLATALVFLGLLLVVGGFVAALGSLFVGQVQSIAAAVPGWVDGAIRLVNRVFNTDISVATVQRELMNRGGSLSGYAGRLAGNVVGVSASLLGLLFQGVTVLLFTYYLSADGPRFRRTVCSVLPPHRQREVLRAWDIAVDKTGGYLYSRGILALISAVSHYVFFLLIGLPYALAVAIFVGTASQFIPTVGTYVAGALPLLVAVTHQPLDALWVAMFILVYQQFENYVLQPRITARTMQLHPAVAFGSVIAGAALLGAVGAVVALPFAASLQAFLGTYIRRYDVDEQAHAALGGSSPPPS